jgi:hypothetical protein
MPIKSKSKALYYAQSPQLFTVEAIPKPSIQKPSRKVSIPFDAAAVKILRYYENLNESEPFMITQNGVVGKLFYSYLDDADLVSLLNTKSEAVETMRDILPVIMPRGKDISDKHIAAICDILMSMFVKDILHIYEILQKKPHGGISQNQIIHNLFMRANINDTISYHAIIKALQRERERVHREPFAIYSIL